MVPGSDGEVVGADLVGHIAVGGNAVGADHTQVHLFGAHVVARSAVGDNPEGNAELLELPGGETAALQPRPGLVDQHLYLFAVFVGDADHTQCGAVVDRGESAGVAVVDEGGFVGNNLKSVEPHPAVGFDVFFKHGVCFGEHPLVEILAAGCIRGLRCPEDAVDRPEQVDGSGTGCTQHGSSFLQRLSGFIE